MSDQPLGWTYQAIDMNARSHEQQQALRLSPHRKPFCTQAKHYPSGRIVYGYGATQDEAQADAERQARNWDEQGS